VNWMRPMRVPPDLAALRTAALCVAVLASLLGTAADDLDGPSIMRKVDGREDGRDARSAATFLLENERGEQRTRKIRRFWLDLDGKEGFHSRTVLFFTAPPDVADTGLLNWSYEETGKDDEQWLYLPAFRKTKRIAAAEKEDSFLGTDFSFEDMSRRKVDEDDHTVLGTETVDGKDYCKVESVPKEKDYPYSKRISWVERDTWIVRKVEYYARKGTLHKTLTAQWKQVKPADGSAPVWMWERALMVDHQKRHKTLVVTDSVELNVGLSDDHFTKMRLEQGAK